MSLVERAVEKLRRAAQRDGETATRAVGTLVQESLPSRGDDPVAVSSRRIKIDTGALRELGYVPEASRERQFADHYRQIKRPLVARALAAATGPSAPNARLIMLASALPGDGKTFTSINLALSLARERDVSVVLVDADLPKPHVSHVFGVHEERGLLDALTDPDVDVESLLIPTDTGSLSILPAGKPNDSAAELLASARMHVIVDRLLSRNPRRIVLFDSPPLLLSSESRALAQYAGQIVLVVRSGTTPRQAVLDVLEEIGDRQVSLVLNQGRVALGGYYGYSDHGAGAAADGAVSG
jgi:exopolysaccharide/PEP-CTERM locus tyrosine autokinase